MKKTLFFTFMLALAFSFNAMSQLGQIGIVGTTNGWGAPDHIMDRDLDDATKYSTFITIAAADTNDLGVIEVKFRENEGWDLNWGMTEGADTLFGTGVVGGPNVTIPGAGTYYVTFDAAISTDTVVTYRFTKTFGSIGLVGTINGWGSAGDDYKLTRSATAMDEYFGNFTITEADTNDDGAIEVKFRENQEWAVNWGAADFPSGVGTAGGANIAAEAGNYHVTFNTTTGAYDFISTAGMVGMIGEFNGWSADHWMDRDMTDPDKFTTMIAFTKEQAGAGDDTVEVKFRENAGWAVNWGAADFPTGTATNGGHNIMVPIDTNALTTDFFVAFEYNQISGTVSEATYTFTPASGVVSMIGAFNDWNGDFPMMRDAADPNIWTATRSFAAVYANDDGIVEVKFRQNADWTVNWGHLDFPTGTGVVGGDNIQLTPGTYDITFNATTLAYSFVENTTVVGEIGMVGDFNEWGAAEGSFDVNLIRDPNHPNYFTLTHNFAASTGILFREDADVLFTDVWGGTFPGGTAVQDAEQIIMVPGGMYDITFDANSGDFSFVQLGNSIVAFKVFAMSVDGILDEADWSISQPVAKVADGTVAESAIVANYGAVYNADNLFIGLEVGNALVANATVDIFVDGDKSGGAFDSHDVVFSVAYDGTVTVLQGPDGIAPVAAIVANTDSSYVLEASIAWADLDVTAVEGEGIGFDMIISVGDDYKLAWNGGMGNYDALTMMGGMTFGQLSCGCISLYNETIGDVVIRNTVDAPTTYIGTYDLDADYNVVFRKDHSSVVTWGDDAFPSGTATVGGPEIPATTNRYRVTFDCVTGEYSFVEEAAAADATTYAQYTADAPVIDGDLSAYALDYKSELVVDPVGGTNNNTVTWSVMWDKDNMYIGINVVDGTVEGAGNPWENDAIEMYIDGDNSKDGAYSGEFDTQLIMDFASNTADGVVDGTDALWVKADGVPITNFNSKWVLTSDGYSIEVRLGWDNFDFAPGKGRVMGFSLGNNDSDGGVGRDYQTMWYGTASNWNNTALLGDMQLAGGDYDYGVGIIDSKVLNNANIELFPNPTSGNVYLKSVDDVFNGNVNVYVIDITGKVVVNSIERIYGSNDVIEVNTSNLRKGIYLVNVVGVNGERAVKKLIIQ